MKMEVRCGCQPEKLLGWFMVPDGFNSRYLQFPVLADLDRLEFMQLPIAPIMDPDRGERGRYLAIKAEGLTKEDLCKYPGFIPNEN
jgi:hypothetical protein